MTLSSTVLSTFTIYYNGNEHTFVEKEGIITEYATYPSNSKWKRIGNFWVRRFPVNKYYEDFKNMYLDKQSMYSDPVSSLNESIQNLNPYE
jgi:hypothetical protein